MASSYFLFFLFIPCFAQSQLIGTYQYSRLLSTSPFYHVFWNYNSTDVSFAVQVATGGWIGWGINSLNLYYMLYSDVSLSWIDANGIPHVADGWIGGVRQPPSLYEEQNFILVGGSQQNGITTVEFHRKLITPECSPNGPDVAINTSATLAWIYASNSNDIPLLSDWNSTFFMHNIINTCEFFSLETGGNYVGSCINNCTSPTQGVCNTATSLCTCLEGFFGIDCSQIKMCNSNADCSNGTCDLMTYSCICRTGWTGANCATPAPSSTVQYPNSLSLLGGNYMISWKIEGSEIEIRLDSQFSGWIGFGIGQGNGMQNADLYIGSVSRGVAIVQDYYAVQNGVPSLDTIDNVLSYNGSLIGGKVSVTFRRLLVTPDGNDKPITRSFLNCIVAFNREYSQVSPATQHLTSDREMLNINFFTGASELVLDPLPIAHGTLMFVSWSILVPAATFLPRFFKYIGHKWFILHAWVFNLIAVAATIAAFGIILKFIPQGFIIPNPYYESHAWIGLIIIGTSVFQGLVGWLADRKFDPNREKLPIFPDRTHQIIGYSLIALAAINIGLGMNVYGLSSNWFIAYGMWILTVILVWVCFTIFKVGKGKEQEVGVI